MLGITCHYKADTGQNLKQGKQDHIGNAGAEAGRLGAQLAEPLEKLSELSDILKISSDRIGHGVYTGTRKVESLYRRVLEKTPLLYRRIVDAFPTMRSKYNEQLTLLRERMHRKKSKKTDDPLSLPAPVAKPFSSEETPPSEPS